MAATDPAGAGAQTDPGPQGFTLDRGLRHELIVRLQTGRYPPGGRLPGERELAADLGVSRMTLRRTLQHLEAEGVLVASSKRGWYVATDAVGEPPSTLQSFTEMANARGQRASATVLGSIRRTPDPDEAAQLGIDDHEPVIELTRLRSIDDRLVGHDRSVLIADRVPGLLEADLTDDSLFRWLESRAGIEVSRSSYVLSAAMMPPELTVLLGVPPVSAALIADEVTFDSDQRAFMVSRLVYRADAYHFRSDLFRPAKE